jgi:hypothetical protein
LTALAVDRPLLVERRFCDALISTAKDLVQRRIRTREPF